MPHLLRALLSIFLLAFWGAAPAWAGQMRVKPVTILDRNGFERPMPAGRMLLPHDWTAHGSLFWNVRNLCQAETIQSDFVAASPDGQWSVRVAGGTGWIAASFPIPQNGGCTQAAVTSVEQFLRLILQRYKPDAQVLHLGRRHDLEKANGLAAVQQKVTMPGGGWYSTEIQIGELAIRYPENGVTYDEAARVIIIMNRSFMPGLPGMYGVPGTPDLQSLDGRSLPFIVMRAPAGQLKAEHYNFVESSYRVDPEWNRRMAEHYAKMNKIAIKGAQDRAAINRKYSQDISDIIHSGYQSRSRMQDRMHEKTTDAIRGVEPYVDSETGERVKLPHEYGHAWKLDDGSYLVTDNPNLNPNVDLQINARRMQRGGY